MENKKVNGLLTIVLTILFNLLDFHSLAQNVGISTPMPEAKLQINNYASIRPTIKLFDSAANSGRPAINFQNAGGPHYWQAAGNIDNNNPAGSYFDIYSSQTGNFMLTVRGNGNVGVGNSNPINKLDVGGDINLTGALKIAGNPGTTGQILSSNGTSAPAWRTAALSNNTRFSAALHPVSGNSIYLNDITVTYNTSADVSFTTEMLINRTGLYHFAGFLYAAANCTTLQSTDPICYLYLETGSPFSNYQLLHLPLPKFGAAGASYRHAQPFSIDLYLTASTTVKFLVTYSYTGAAFLQSSGWITGYLISD